VCCVVCCGALSSAVYVVVFCVPQFMFVPLSKRSYGVVWYVRYFEPMDRDQI
jgi:hypothetical protein